MPPTPTVTRPGSFREAYASLPPWARVIVTLVMMFLRVVTFFLVLWFSAVALMVLLWVLLIGGSYLQPLLG